MQVHDDRGNLITGKVTRRSDGWWYVSFIGDVAVGNGRHVLGFVKEVRCVAEADARSLAIPS